MTKKIKLALIYGGKGLEREVSISGAKDLYPLLKGSFEVIPIFINEKGSWLTLRNNTDSTGTLPQGSDLEVTVAPINLGGTGALISDSGVITEIDCAFPLLHGDYGEDGSVQGALETAGIPFLGCRATESAVCYDKIYTKILAESLGIPTAKYVPAINASVEEAKLTAEKELSYPMFIKPARLGSSFGTALVKSSAEFEKAYENAKKLGGGRILIEEAINIEAELECVCFGAEGKESFTNIGDIRYDSEFYDYDTKYSGEKSVTVNSVSEYERAYGGFIREASKKLKDLIGIRELARFDFFLDKTGRVIFNEINTIPGFTKTSLCPRLIEDFLGDLRSALYSVISEKGKAL